MAMKKTTLIAGVVAGGGILLIIMLLCCIACCIKRKRNKERTQMNYFVEGGKDYFNSTVPQQVAKIGNQYSSGPWLAEAPPPPPPGMVSSEIYSALPPPHPGVSMGGFNQGTFSYKDLAAATSSFSRENLLGQGGFGYVHKGVLPDGKEIAVKSLKSGSGQGEREFQAEVEIISRVHHKHLVSLVGYCISDMSRMLVYEFMPNNSLEYHLYGRDMPVMDFPTRLKIALGSAKGFAYLHEDCHPRIIHRDIKAANILLDYNYEAKVADFGLAKLSNETHTHVSTRIMGTFGYLAPEYAASGKLTEKSDVYSYGVVLLELITGKRPIDISGDDENDNLVEWARPILVEVTEGGSYEELVDPRLGDNYVHEEMLRMVACAAACIRQSGKRRPRMSQVVRALQGDASLEDLNEGVRSSHNAMFGSSGSSESGSNVSGIRKVRPRGNAILSSNEFTSSEHPGELGNHASPSSSTDSHIRTP